MIGRHTDPYYSYPWKTQNYYHGGGGEEDDRYGGDGRRRPTVTFAPVGNYDALKETVVERTQTHSYVTDYTLPVTDVSDLGKIKKLPVRGPPPQVEPARYYPSNATNGSPPAYYYWYSPAPPRHHSYSPSPALSLLPPPGVEATQHVRAHPMATRPTKYWQKLGPRSSDNDRRSHDAVSYGNGYVVGDDEYDDGYEQPRGVEPRRLPAATMDFQATRSAHGAPPSRTTKLEDAGKPMHLGSSTGTGAAYGFVENKSKQLFRGLKVGVPKHAGLGNTGKGAYGGVVDNNAAETIDSREAAKRYGGVHFTRDYNNHNPGNYSKRDSPPDTITSWDAAILWGGVLVEDVAFSPKSV